MKKLILLTMLLGMFVSVPAFAQNKIQVGVAGALILGKDNTDPNTIPTQGDNFVGKMMVGYEVSKRIMVGVQMEQFTMDEQFYAALGKFYVTQSDSGWGNLFIDTEIGGLSTLGNSRFAITPGLGAELKLGEILWDFMDPLYLSGKVKNVADFTSGGLTAAQLTEVMLLTKFVFE